MSRTELKLRIIFASCALLALGAALAQVVTPGRITNWPLVAAMVASLLITAAEALGLCRLARMAHWRLLAAVLIGVAALYLLEC